MAGLRSVQVLGRLALSLGLLISAPALLPAAQAAEEQPAAASSSTCLLYTSPSPRDS